MKMKEIVPGLQVLSGYFGEFLSDAMEEAGCNDMPSKLFECLTLAQKQAIHADFLSWDKAANPEDWEPKRLGSIPDFLWVKYFMDRTFDEEIMNNKMIGRCEFCGQDYCQECTTGNGFDWKTYCSAKCERESDAQDAEEAERSGTMTEGMVSA